MALAQASARDSAVDITALRKRRDVKGTAFQAVMLFSLFISLGVLVVLLFIVVRDAWPVLSTRLGDFLTGTLGSQPETAGISQGLKGTFYLCLIVAVVAFPLGIAAAVYLEEYAPRNRLSNFIELNIRNLAGVPSVVYGILGLTIFVQGWGISKITGGRSPLAGGLTLAALVLPVVIITAQEAIRAVPSALREAGFGVGATKWEVIKDHVLPYAAPGILTGTLLSIARAAGEAAPLLLVGTITGFISNSPGWLEVSQVRDKFAAMPIIITTWTKQPEEGFKVDNAAAAIVILILFVIVLNTAAIVLRNRFEAKRAG
ncbi:MAG: phosphate ABC transporter permease PstA [Acidimicrobiales bacterium]